MGRTEEPEPGRYRHFKGGLYDVVAVATTERDERVVIYRAESGEWHTRTLRSWNNRTPKGNIRFEPARSTSTERTVSYPRDGWDTGYPPRGK